MELFNYRYTYLSSYADSYVELYLLLSLKRGGNVIKTYEFVSLNEVEPALSSATSYITSAIGGAYITLPPFLDVPPNADTRYSVEGVIMRRSNGRVWKTDDMKIKGFSLFLQGVKR